LNIEALKEEEKTFEVFKKKRSTTEINFHYGESFRNKEKVD